MDGMQRLYFGNLALDPNRQRQIVYYGRVSTEHEAQLEALEKQMQWYEDQTKYHPNWTVVGRYIDEGITGTLAKKRPAFMQMIEDAKRRKFDLIVTREVCRFARNTVDTLVLTRELRNYGVEVYFVSDNIWTMDGDGELRLTIMATLAQEESRKISERVRAGQAISRENGVLYGNGNIIGYDRVGGTYVINPEQAETIRTIFELYAQGLGQKELVNELTRRGCKDGNGNVKWSCVTVSVGTAVVIAQVIDTISHLYDCNRSVRILTIYPYHQSCIRESCPFIPSVFDVIGHFTQLKITFFQICDIIKEFRWCLLSKLLRKRTGHSIRNQVIPILCHISAPPHVLAHAPSVENSSPKFSKCDFPSAVWCSRSENTAPPC